MSGPILRVHHMTKETQKQSTESTAVGKGLRYANVGEVTEFKIRVANSSMLHDVYFSALAVGDNHMFTANPSPPDNDKLEISFYYTPTMEGGYDLYIEEIEGKTKDQSQVPGSPFRLVVQGPKVNQEAERKFTDSLPSCQTIPQNNLSWVEGSWKTRRLVGSKHGVLRSGWVFQPKICSFDTFTEEEIAVAAASLEPTTIAILGSSAERGIFLSLVDLALTEREKVHLNKSNFAKCWGFAELQIGNLRIIYQDFRIAPSGSKRILNENNVIIICHNEKKVVEGYHFFDDALGFLREYLFNDRLWPDVILVTVSDPVQLQSLFKVIPTSWKGVIYPTNTFKVNSGRFYTASGVEEYKEQAMKYLPIDKRIHIFDAFALTTGVRHGSQSSPRIMRSNHFHRWCNELGGRIRVCGDGAEMVAQLLLGKAIAPNGKDVWMRSIRQEHLNVIRNIDYREIMCCHDCPESLLPFHIKRVPDLKCYRSTTGLRLWEEKHLHVWDGTLCPSDCMETKPVGQTQTESGPVDVRECTVTV
ncbi:hypothetical protein HOLleu_04523 [Holothuria leucospilota]|uniref:Uncharacterized protein n=1 Tax=Holothuria leucospilota TaxID=206669 RepID=A0A9Q1CTF5_HOLLE|nr:hypothetical protein HOLleu_04523 [Holothuria leucospilota]